MKPIIIFVIIFLMPCLVFGADFESLLNEVKTAPISPMFNLQPDKNVFINDLEESGRLQELGVTREQAGLLYDILSKRLKVAIPQSPKPFRESKSQPTGPVRYMAEFDPQVGILMRWPIGMPEYLPTYYGMMSAIAESTDTLIIVANAAQEQTVRSQCSGQGISLDRVQFAYWPTDTVWTRDYGPIFIGEGETAPQTEGVVNMAYSRPWRVNDDKIPELVAQALDDPLYDTDLVQDGGNLLTDGHGTCFSTMQIYANNPGWTEEQVAAFYSDYLGCTQLITPQPLLNEGTGHIDMFVKVVKPHTVMVGQYQPGNPNYQRLEDAASLIASSQALDGISYEVVRIPQTSEWILSVLAVFHTYTNGLVAGGKVLVPQYNLAQDTEAKALYETIYPDREVVLVDSQTIIYSGGAIHCITMERQDYSVSTDDDTSDDDTSDDDANDDDTADDDVIDDDMSDDDSIDDDTASDDDENIDDDNSDDDATDDDSADDDSNSEPSEDDDDNNGGNGCGC